MHVKRLVTAAVVATVAAACQSGSRAADGGPTAHVRLIPAPAYHDAAAVITDAMGNSENAGRKLVVYVSGTYCQPCAKFRAAAERGDLDKDFGDLDLLVFDTQVDGERLVNAGYGSRYIPLLVVPGPDGRASSKRLEGSIKGDAVADLTPRLKKLLDR
jgi:hypothetical protein